MKNEYFLGLDVGSNSVGYAVTKTNYELLKFNKKTMWGCHVFEEGNQCADRRQFRSARRRLARKKQRIQLAREIFAGEIGKLDTNFYIRLDESQLLRVDKTTGSKNSLFNDANMTDKDYHKIFPTIHHLIMHLIETNEKQDIRLIYLAVAYILAHRGHFLIEVAKDDIAEVISFDKVYERFSNYFIKNEIASNWSQEIKYALSNILRAKMGIKEKQKQIKTLVYGDISKLEKEQEAIIKAISGGKFNLSDLFNDEEYKEFEYNSISLGDGALDEKILLIREATEEENYELLLRIKDIYDWSLMADILRGEEYISKGKIAIYEQHREDLKLLKYLVKTYKPDKYDEVFKFSKKDHHNYAAFSGNFKSSSNEKSKDVQLHLSKTTNIKFCEYLKKLFKDVSVKPEDEEVYDDFKSRLEIKNAFMPKQVNTDNGVIPYQLYRYEMKAILEKAKNHYKFLSEKDEDGLSAIDKLLSIIEFKVPYYVGPLNEYHGKYSWIERKAEGKILPWNFEEKIDLEKTEEAFIRKMTRQCTYLAGEDVLCKNSLLYNKYMVLNEINNIRINEVPISINIKQRLYKELFEDSKKKISKKRLIEWFVSNQVMTDDQELRGVDDDIKSSLRSFHDFKQILNDGTLNQKQVEEIISRLSITTDKQRLRKFLKSNYPMLSEDNIRKILSLNYNGYGRLSEKLLTGIEVFIPKAAEYTNIIDALWNTNYNLMQLLSSEFGFNKQIEEHNTLYYQQHPKNIDSKLDEMYISNAVKRPIFRTLDIVKEIKGIMHKDPKKIFIEMARGEQEKKRTKSRKDGLKLLYSRLEQELREEWTLRLNSEPEDRLKSERYFLYYMQLGKCMYTGKEISLQKLMDNTYDIDHIYPQSIVKDDSIHNNKVLVNSSENRLKSDIYPLSTFVRAKMTGYWNMLASKGLITKEKLYRLTRKTSFKEEELAGFINRQLVETQQSTKALAELLKDIFPNTEIVYVKAGLVSDFRHQYDMIKSRDVNDLHHAKDAYLNIIMGNVYNIKFTRNPLNFIKSNERYSVNIKGSGGLLSRDIMRNGEIAWKSDGSSISTVKNTIKKNNINYVRYTFCRKGNLFDQQPDKAPNKENELIPRKKNLPTSVYGGYNNSTASFFTLVKHTYKGKPCISIRPVDLYIEDKFINDDSFALDYCRTKLGLINPEFFPFRKIIKVNTLLCLDGFRASIASKSNKGKTIVLSSNIPLILSIKDEKYVKRLSSVTEKAKKNKVELKINEVFDKITRTENESLYKTLKEKCKANIFNTIPAFNIILNKMQEGEEIFKSLGIEDQVKALINIVNGFRTGRTTGCNLKIIGGSVNCAVITMNSEITNTKFSSIEIIDQSATGLFEKKTGNLLEL